MGTFKLLSGKLGTVTFTATSTHSSYPLANLQTYFAADQWRSNSGSSPQYLNLDLGVAREINGICVQNHNLIDTDTGDGVVMVEYDTADNPAFTSPASAVNIYTSTDPAFFTFTARTKRYWRIKFGIGQTLDQPPQIGNVFIAKYFELVDDFEFGFSPFHPRFSTTVHTTKTGAIRTRAPFGGRQEMKFSMKIQNDTFKSEFQRFLGEVNGMQFPFYFITDAGVVYYVHFGEDYAPLVTVIAGRHNVQTITLRNQLTD